MIATTASLQQQEWNSLYLGMIENALKSTLVLVRENRNQPIKIRPHFASILAQLDWAYEYFPELAVQIVLSLHPWPARWGLLEDWITYLKLPLDLLIFSEAKTQKDCLLACLADTYYISGQLELALSMSQDALACADHNPDRIRLIGLAGFTAVSALKSLGQVEEAENLLSSLERQLDHIGEKDNSEIVVARTSLAICKYDFLRRKGHVSAALDLINGILNNIKDASTLDAYTVEELFELRAIFHWTQGNYQAALADLNCALKNYVMEGEYVTEASIHANTGLVYWNMAQYDLAEKELLYAVSITEKYNALYLQMRQVGNLALVYFSKGELEKALLYANRQIELATLSNQAYERELAIGNRASFLVYANQVETALPDLFDSLGKYERQNRLEPLVATLGDIALSYLKLGDFSKASIYGQKAFHLTEENDNLRLKLIGLRCLALLYQSEKSFKKAKITITKAYKLSKKLGQKLDEAGCIFSLTTITSDEQEKVSYWEKGVRILGQIGALKWLDGKSVSDPPVIPIM